MKMAIQELRFKVRHSCPFNDLSKKHPDASIYQWCNYTKDIMQISFENGPQQAIKLSEDVMAMARKAKVRIIRKSMGDADLQFVLQCFCPRLTPNVTFTLEKHNMLKIPPIVYRDGWEWYNTVAFKQDDIRGFLTDLSRFADQVEIVSKTSNHEFAARDNLTVSTASILGRLSRKQLWALREALRSDYYDVPKRTTTKKIAKLIGIPHTTYEEHLRKAEGKVMRSISPLVELRES